jgi:hypothetical protein
MVGCVCLKVALTKDGLRLKSVLCYREAVTKHSPGLSRFAVTLGSRLNSINFLSQEADTTPLWLLSFRRVTQGSREARQPWAGLHNRFAVMTGYSLQLRQGCNIDRIH